MDMLEQMAAHWLKAERDASPDAWKDIDFADAITVAKDRVQRVYDGDVTWSNATPGDRIVWQGRPRVREVFEKWRTAEKSRQEQERDADERIREHGPLAARQHPRLVGCRERLWWNFYDTTTIASAGAYNLFQGPVGDVGRTNMSVRGMFDMEATFVVLSVYCVPLAAVHEVPWRAITGRLIVGLKPATPSLPLSELYMGCDLLRPYVVPVRQSVYMQIDVLEDVDEPFDLVCHAEGLLTRDVA